MDWPGGKPPYKEVYEKTPSQMDLAPWRLKVGWINGWNGSLGGVRYRAPYGANEDESEKPGATQATL